MADDSQRQLFSDHILDHITVELFEKLLNMTYIKYNIVII